MENKKDIENKLKDLEVQLKNAFLERREAISDGGWHDNARVDSINAEIYVLEDRIRTLKRQFFST